MKPTILCLLLACCVSGLKAQTAMSRLVGATGHMLNSSAAMTPTDSTAYFFTGDNGGDLSHEMKYTTDTTWADSASGYVPLSVENQAFDDSNNVVSATILAYDSGVWTDSLLITNTYDVNNKLTESIIQNWSTATSAWVNRGKGDYTYNAASNVTSQTASVWDAGTAAWVPTSKDSTIYNSSEQNVASLQQLWNTGSSAWVNHSYDTLTLDGSGNLVTDLTLSWTGSSWMNFTKHVYTYDGSNARLTDTAFSASATSGWMYNQLTVDSNDAAGLTLNSVTYNWIPSGSRFVPGERTQLTYNTYNQLTSIIDFEYTNTGHWSFGPTNYYGLYYYETYTSHVGTPIVKAENVTLTISPNPAAEYLRIQLQQEEATPFDVEVYDMHGRVMRALHEAGTVSYNRLLPAHDWAPGSYLVVVNVAGRSITKQFVVMH